MSDPTDTLRARVEQAQDPQPPPTWLVYVPGNGWEEPGTEQQARDVMDHVADELREEAGDGWNEEAESLIMYRAVQVAAFTLTITAKPGDGTADGERCEASGWDFMARGDVVDCSPPDLAALVADLWAEVKRLTAERDSLRSQVGEASHVLASALYGEERAGEQAHLPSLARMMVDALTLEAANAEQARMQLDNGDDVDAATRRYLGEALGIADSDDTPPSLSDFYDAVVEARAERDAALDEVARLRGEAEAPAVAGGRELVWVEGGRGWHLSRSGRDWWTTAPYSAWRDGYATTDDVLGRVTRCANCPNACRQIAEWARADGYIVPLHPLGWDVGVSDG